MLQNLRKNAIIFEWSKPRESSTGCLWMSVLLDLRLQFSASFVSVYDVKNERIFGLIALTP